MAWFKKNKVVYQVQGRERGHLEAFVAQQKAAELAYLGVLKSIMEREGFKPEGVEFDPNLMAFVKVKK